MSLLSDNKKYYWLKLKTNFFDSKEMLRLRSIAGGDTYTIIYLKMLLLSLKTDGLLEYDGIDATQDEEIALLLHESLDNVKLTIAFLKRVGLLEMANKNDFFLNQVPTLTGSETQAAERKRRYRENIKVGQCPADVLPMSQKCPARDKSIEIEKENKSKKDKTYSPSLPSVAEDIVTFLNSMVGSNYKSTTSKTRKLIAARLAEGFTVDDFKAVITKKAKEWQGTDMAQYLRPETLFGTKFEGYLNQLERNNRRSPLSRAEQERQEAINVVNELIAEYEEEERQNGQSKHDESNSTASIGF